MRPAIVFEVDPRHRGSAHVNTVASGCGERDWGRCCLADAPVVVEFRAPMSPEQQQWLRKTHLHMRRVAFHIDDAASAALLHDTTTLVRGLLPAVLSRSRWWH